MAFEDLTPLRAGDQAPDFTLPSALGPEVTLSEIVTTKPVVLTFVPVAFTGICTGEFCELRDNIELFQESSVQLIGVSVDPKAAQRVWSEQEGFDFPILSDFWPHGAVAKSYGVFLEDRGIATRATFVIDGAMTIRAAFVNPPSDPRPIQAYREAIAALG